MGDYVLESNPALGRLIERLGEPGKAPAPEQRSRLHDSTRKRRRRRAKAARGMEAADLVAEVVVEDGFWANREDPPGADEMVLVDFDEEPEVFADELGRDGDDTMEGDEDDEILDLYGPADLDEDVDDDVTVQAVGAIENEEEVWIFDAFKAWMLEAVEAPG